MGRERKEWKERERKEGNRREKGKGRYCDRIGQGSRERKRKRMYAVERKTNLLFSASFSSHSVQQQCRVSTVERQRRRGERPQGTHALVSSLCLRREGEGLEGRTERGRRDVTGGREREGGGEDIANLIDLINEKGKEGR